MKHRYNVLWFEDSGDVLDQDYKPELEEFLEEHGFVLELEARKTFSEGDQIDYRRYDLIITDLNLGGDTPDDAGGRVLQAVRQDQVLTDIVFYSSSAIKLSAVLKQIGFINRVTVHSGRQGLMEVVKSVVLLTIRKGQSVSSVRGQFIAQAIDLEHRLVDFLVLFLNEKAFPELAATKAAKWSGFVEHKTKLLAKQSEAIKAFKPNAGGSLHEQRFIQTFDCYILAKDGLEDLKNHFLALARAGNAEMAAKAAHVGSLRERLVQFNDEVIDVRNTLAHVRETITDGVYTLKSRKANGQEIAIDDAWCTTTRKKLRAHYENLEKMAQLIV